jgi:hypothetical protein
MARSVHTLAQILIRTERHPGTAIVGMKVNSPYSYRLLLQNKQIGPFDRRTIVGMRIKKIVASDVAVLRSDGLMMNVSQLMADRLEMADPVTGHLPSIPSMPTGLGSEMWPTFTVDFGGGLRPGTMGFIGAGELRYQGDMLRLSGQRKTGIWGKKMVREKLALADISAFDQHFSKPNVVTMTLRLGHPLAPAGKDRSIALVFEDAVAVQELVAMVRPGLG